jgi:hypothetical protein
MSKGSYQFWGKPRVAFYTPRLIVGISTGDGSRRSAMLGPARNTLGLLLIGLTCFQPSSAFAFTCETPFSGGCHEQLTADALRTAGWPNSESAPAITSADNILLKNLLFHPPSDLHDRWTTAMLIGVRHTDFAGHRPTSPDLLAAIHNDIEGQGAHCLRSPEDDGVTGNATAANACRAYIMKEVENAIGPSDAIDLTDTVNIKVSLKYEETTLALSRFAFHMGHALHALQDSFTHTFRHPANPKLILSFFNYVDPAFKNDYSPEVDGHKHSSAFDTCEPGQNLFRVEQATTASVELLLAAGSAGTRSERFVQVHDVLDAWLTPTTESCEPSNGYCGVMNDDGTMIEDLAVAESAFDGAGCHLRPNGTSTAPLFALLVLVLWLARRRLWAGGAV